MSFLFLVLAVYLVSGAALTFSWIKWGGLAEDGFAFIVCGLWPVVLIFFGGNWVWEKTPWYRRRKWRRRLRIAVSEEDEPDEAFLKRSKRL